MASYITPELPKGIEVNKRALDFFDAFYKTSDTPEAHEAYAKMFTSDADFILASKKVAGYDDILAVRKGMWAPVATRHHVVSQIYPFSPGSNEYMLLGNVKYTAKTGQASEKEWAAHAILAEDASGQLKLKFYQIYLDTAAPA